MIKLEVVESQKSRIWFIIHEKFRFSKIKWNIEIPEVKFFVWFYKLLMKILFQKQNMKF